MSGVPGCDNCATDDHTGESAGWCTFHWIRHLHERGDCDGAQGNPRGCFFCPEPGLARSWMSQPGTPTAPIAVINNMVTVVAATGN